MQGRFIDQWRDIMKKYFNGFCEEDIGLLSTICNEYLPAGSAAVLPKTGI
jgi:hypothetical protein